MKKQGLFDNRKEQVVVIFTNQRMKKIKSPEIFDNRKKQVYKKSKLWNK